MFHVCLKVYNTIYKNTIFINLTDAVWFQNIYPTYPRIYIYYILILDVTDKNN